MSTMMWVVFILVMFVVLGGGRYFWSRGRR